MRRRSALGALLGCLWLTGCTSGGGLLLGGSHHSGGSGGLHLGGTHVGGTNIGGAHPSGGNGLLGHLSLPSLGTGHSTKGPGPIITVPSAPSSPITLPDLDLNLGGPPAKPAAPSARGSSPAGQPSGPSPTASGRTAASPPASTPADHTPHHMSLGRLPSAHWHNPLRGLFGGTGALSALTVGLASALITGVTAMVTAVATVGLTVALLPVVLMFALTGAIFAGVFGLAGIMFSVLGFLVWLWLRDVLVVAAVAFAALLALVLGAVALIIGAALLGVAAWRARRRQQLAVP
jgi:hypothetical protein